MTQMGRFSLATDLADAVVVGVADIDQALGSKCRAKRAVESDSTRRPAIAIASPGGRCRVKKQKREPYGLNDRQRSQ